MRRVVLALLLAGCGGSSHPPAAPAPTSESPADAATSDLTLPTISDEFKPPVSKPSGDPFTLKRFTPAIGLRRTRAIDHSFDVDDDLGDKHFKQHTATTFVLREEVAVVDTSGTITQLRVTADTAEEHIELDGTPHDTTLLSGTYVVGPGGTGAHPDGSQVYSREQEELAGIYAGEVGANDVIASLLLPKPLRVGETIKLDDADKQRIGGAESDVFLTLVSTNLGVATYQFTSTFAAPYALGSEGDVENVGVKSVVTFDIATGRLLRLDSQDRRVVTGKRGSVRASHHVTRFEYR